MGGVCVWFFGFVFKKADSEKQITPSCLSEASGSCGAPQRQRDWVTLRLAIIFSFPFASSPFYSWFSFVGWPGGEDFRLAWWCTWGEIHAVSQRLVSQHQTTCGLQECSGKVHFCLRAERHPPSSGSWAKTRVPK